MANHKVRHWRGFCRRCGMRRSWHGRGKWSDSGTRSASAGVSVLRATRDGATGATAAERSEKPFRRTKQGCIPYHYSRAAFLSDRSEREIKSPAMRSTLILIGVPFLQNWIERGILRAAPLLGGLLRVGPSKGRVKCHVPRTQSSPAISSSSPDAYLSSMHTKANK